MPFEGQMDQHRCGGHHHRGSPEQKGSAMFMDSEMEEVEGEEEEWKSTGC